jgi:urea transport system permease protein
MMHVTNWVHGEFFMLGAYVVLLITQAGGSYWLGLVVAPIVVALVGMLLETLFVRRLFKNLEATVLLTWGLSICLRQLVRLILGPQWKAVQNPLGGSVRFLGISYPIYRMYMILLAVVVMALVWFLMQRTRFGLYCRAVIQDREMASAIGINTQRTDMVAFGLGAGLAGLAGVAMSPLVTTEPDMGLAFLGDSFQVVIVGGAGRILGVLVGGLVLGAIQAIVSFSVSAVWSKIMVFLFAGLIIRIRPSGLLGRKREA